jgi:hypothetical protein
MQYQWRQWEAQLLNCRGGAVPDTTAALLLAALHSAETGSAAARRQFADLSELARDPAAAAAMESQGAMAAIASAFLRHGTAVDRATMPLIALLSDAAAGGAWRGKAEGEEEVLVQC